MKIKLLLVILFITNISLYSQPYQIEWQSCFGGTESDYISDVVEIENGYLLLGTTSSSNGDISYYHGGYNDVWLVCIDYTGTLIWEKTFGGSESEGGARIFKTEDNYFYLLCGTTSSDGDISNDPYPGSLDYWIVKIDSTGNILWDRILGGGILDQLWTGTLTDDGGIVAYGWSGSTDGDVSINYGAYDMWMVKLNGEGEKEWDFSIGTDWFDYGQAIIQTSDGGFLCGGSSAIGEGGNLTCDPFNYNAEAILVKLDKDRNIEWQQCYGGSGHDGVWSIMELEDGYIFTGVGASNDGALTGSGYHGDGDIWFVKIDFWGNIIWQKCFGGTGYEYTDRIFQSTNGDFIVIGVTTSKDGDIIGNHSVSEYANDIWMIKISSEGELLSQQCIGGGGDERMDFGVIKKSDYDFVIAGQTDYGPSFDVQCTPHSFYPPGDFWVFEIKDTLTSIQTKPTVGVEVKVYPNPANDKVKFEFGNIQNLQQAQLRCYDVFGSLLHSEAVVPGQKDVVLDITTWPPGMYVAVVYSNGGVVGRCKFVVE
jgi:hypothetical protein